MAHKKGEGSSENGRDSNSKRLGVKLYGGQLAIPGNIIIRQKGTKYHPGKNVGMGKDFTIFAMTEGTVQFQTKKKDRVYVSVMPFATEVIETIAAPLPKAAPKVEAAPKAEPKKEVEEPVAEVKTAPASEPEAFDAEQGKSALLGVIGIASADEKDDLKEIKGIGPKLEEMLHSIGVYTFAQVSKMGDAEYDLVDSLITAFKGRAKRDNWAAQASELMHK